MTWALALYRGGLFDRLWFIGACEALVSGFCDTHIFAQSWRGEIVIIEV